MLKITDGGIRRGKNNTMIVDENRRQIHWRMRAYHLSGPFRIIANRATGTAMVNTPIFRDAPDAPVWADTAKNGSVDLVVLRCPYCGGEHRHGGADKGATLTDYLGGRVAHCSGLIEQAGFGHTPYYSAEYRLVLFEGRPSQEEMDELFPLVEWPETDD